MSSTLTEVEIFARMRESLALAAEHCDHLAVESLRGPIYEKLRDELALIEGCCQQASAHREDTRWLPISLLMAECHKKAGGWLRGYKIDGETVKLAMGELNLHFVELAKHLRSLLKVVEQYQTQRTGRVGMIVPVPVRPFLREDRKHRVRLPDVAGVTNGGILIPTGVAA